MYWKKTCPFITPFKTFSFRVTWLYWVDKERFSDGWSALFLSAIILFQLVGVTLIAYHHLHFQKRNGRSPVWGTDLIKSILGKRTNSRPFGCGFYSSISQNFKLMIFWVMFDLSGAKKFSGTVGDVSLKSAKEATTIRTNGTKKFNEMLLAKKWKKNKNF